MRWALFFAGMAVLNEIVWRTQTTNVWVTFKAVGVTLLTAVFAVAQMPLINRTSIAPVSLEESETEAGDVSKG
jgi:intracellular septation protein